MQEIYLENPRRKTRKKKRRNTVVKTARNSASVRASSSTSALRVANKKRRVKSRKRRNGVSSSRSRNPLTTTGIMNIAKDAGKLAIGGVATKVIANLLSSLPFISGFLGNPFAPAVLEAAVAVIPVNWLGKKVFKGDNLVMLGGLAVAGMDAANAAAGGDVTSRVQGYLPAISISQPQNVAINTPLSDVGYFPQDQSFNGGLGDVAYFPANESFV